MLSGYMYTLVNYASTRFQLETLFPNMNDANIIKKYSYDRSMFKRGDYLHYCCTVV